MQPGDCVAEHGERRLNHVSLREKKRADGRERRSSDRHHGPQGREPRIALGEKARERPGTPASGRQRKREADETPHSHPLETVRNDLAADSEIAVRSAEQYLSPR